MKFNLIKSLELKVQSKDVIQKELSQDILSILNYNKENHFELCDLEITDHTVAIHAFTPHHCSLVLSINKQTRYGAVDVYQVKINVVKGLDWFSIAKEVIGRDNYLELLDTQLLPRLKHLEE